jgi:CelD/BcsL family acetyltransferase involved in cellulose biosynthesis
MSAALPLPLRFQIGPRTLFSVRRKLVRHGFSLDDCLATASPDLPPLAAGDHGYLLTSVPESQLEALGRDHGELITLVRQRYPRHYADLAGSFDDYLGRFSGKSRSTLRRKTRKFAKLSGGTLTIKSYQSPAELAEFHRLALPLSQSTYQERLLDAGLPDTPEFVAEMSALAGRDDVRGWILFLAGKPASYLYAPARGDTLLYAYLGYDPDLARHSPGAVLQFEAMKALFSENQFARFDFTEGDGQHKRQFATANVPCADVLLLRKSISNLALGYALRGFDRMVVIAKSLGLRSFARKFAR